MQGCAQRSVALLDQAAAGQHTFDALFLTSHSPVTTYDYLFHVHIPQQLPPQLQASDVAPWHHAEKKLEALVKQVCCLTPLIAHQLSLVTQHSSLITLYSSALRHCLSLL